MGPTPTPTSAARQCRDPGEHEQTPIPRSAGRSRRSAAGLAGDDVPARSPRAGRPARRRTPTGCSYFATSEIVSSWDRSPHSAAEEHQEAGDDRPVAADVPGQHLVLRPAARRRPGGCAPSRTRITAPARNISPAAAWTTSWQERHGMPEEHGGPPPARRTQADADPQGSGDTSSRATASRGKVLSGSSTTKMARKVRPMTTGSIRGFRPCSGSVVPEWRSTAPAPQ